MRGIKKAAGYRPLPPTKKLSVAIQPKSAERHVDELKVALVVHPPFFGDFSRGKRWCPRAHALPCNTTRRGEKRTSGSTGLILFFEVTMKHEEASRAKQRNATYTAYLPRRGASHLADNLPVGRDERECSTWLAAGFIRPDWCCRRDRREMPQGMPSSGQRGQRLALGIWKRGRGRDGGERGRVCV